MSRTATAIALWVVLCASVSPIAAALPLPSEADLAGGEDEAVEVAMASLTGGWPSELHSQDGDEGGLEGDSWFASVASLTDLARERALLNEEFGFDEWGDFQDWESWADLDFGFADFGDAAGGSPSFDIPDVVLEAYRNAASLSGTVEPSCQVRWSILAGIGWVESNHGRHGGAGATAAGDVRPHIVGPPLDGSPGVREIRDSDGGQWDGDRVYDRAVGPMQFIPSSWRVYGQDGNGDGVRDPHNVYDAALAAAAHLCVVSPGDYTDRGQLAKALFGYNRSMEYVGVVMARIDAYDNNVPVGDGTRVAFGGGATDFDDVRFDDSGYTPPPPRSNPQPSADRQDPQPSTNPSTPQRPATEQPKPPPTDRPAPDTGNPDPTPKPNPNPNPSPNPGPGEPTDPPPVEEPTDPPPPPPPPCEPKVSEPLGAFVEAGSVEAMRGAAPTGSDAAVATLAERLDAGLRYDVGRVRPAPAPDGAATTTFTFDFSETTGKSDGGSGSGTAACDGSGISAVSLVAAPPREAPTDPPSRPPSQGGGDTGGGATERPTAEADAATDG